MLQKAYPNLTKTFTVINMSDDCKEIISIGFIYKHEAEKYADFWKSKEENNLRLDSIKDTINKIIGED